MRSHRSFMVFVAAIALCLAAESEDHPVHIDPNNAGPDYPIQGEYEGAGPQGKMGVQVVALGDGKFQAVVLSGGLPGDGFDGKGRLELPGTRQGTVVSFPPVGNVRAEIRDGKIAVTRGQDAPQVLNKVERQSPDAGAKPPPGATVLFDGTNTDAWQDGKMDQRHLLEAGTKTRKKYQDFALHVEFLLPFKPFARDQDRGNSGIYMQDRYEVQILDTFGHPPEFNGCGSLYRQKSPLVNMCYPPLRWQTYDIDFHAARFDSSGKKVKNAVVTVRQNGVLVQDHQEITSKTGAGAPEGPGPGAIQLQGHHNPVFFRNIWVIDRGSGK